MNLNQRIEILVKLGEYLSTPTEAWLSTCEAASRENGWFVPEFIDLAVKNIVQQYLQPATLFHFVSAYPSVSMQPSPIRVGLVMAGNIPLVGFHDFLCCFLAGHQITIKLSSKDRKLMEHLLQQLINWAPELSERIQTAELLKGCDAYIATGSNNSGRYFEYYFQNYPSIIRKNRTSAAIITGSENKEELEALASDMLLYFGLGCRNVSKIWVPESYDFLPLLSAMEKFRWMADHNKFRNNYDYNLSLHILNGKYYMTNGIVLLVEDPRLFSAISQIHYSFYSPELGIPAMPDATELQCLTGKGHIPFGMAQQPSIFDFADGVDTMRFLTNLQS